MQLVVSALGSAGDVHPFIAISQVLRARGHRVRMLASPYLEARIRRAGIEFTPLGAPGDFERLLQRSELWHPRQGARFVLDELLTSLRDAFTTTATITPGSAMAHGAAFFANAVEACTSLGQRAAHQPVSRPAASDLARRDDARSVRAFQRLAAAPPRAGGTRRASAGIRAQALAAGIPKLVVTVAKIRRTATTSHHVTTSRQHRGRPATITPYRPPVRPCRTPLTRPHRRCKSTPTSNSAQ